MKEIQERNVNVYIYLMKLDPEKWTLLHDGGHRHGIMTTNISEALNSVLKKARILPLKALVELIFNKLVKYFHQHREEAENCLHPFPTRIFDKFLLIEMKLREHKVTTYNPREGIYMVRSPIRVSGMGNNVYTLRLNKNHAVTENGKHIHCLVLMFLQCVEKMGQEQILMCRRYIRDKRTEELTKRIFIWS
ncbi:hypothetical protein M9H77_04435 [Catharanthus roseus]|uniref:Uncharacterized protein n=1 Tax=Catharanthus roseus TaxID=4058 RepID=A0ACC0CEB0_CATRO|nr:hypothetical protein M9H77_04435 [Catharanthus roseus]